MTSDLSVTREEARTMDELLDSISEITFADVMRRFSADAETPITYDRPDRGFSGNRSHASHLLCLWVVFLWPDFTTLRYETVFYEFHSDSLADTLEYHAFLESRVPVGNIIVFTSTEYTWYQTPAFESFQVVVRHRRSGLLISFPLSDHIILVG